MKKILVTGGAGYIGSHFCKLLSKSGYMPIVVDNLSRGNLNHVKFGPFYNCDVRDLDSLTDILRRERPEVVAHFAGYAYVNESVNNPDLYLNNNIFGTAQLIRACTAASIDRVLFSSSCAVYGDSAVPLKEDAELRPINPYGYSKLIGENMLRQFAIENQATGGNQAANEKDLVPKRVIALRYFNAAGADSEGQLGAIHQPETRIIPLILRAALDPDYVLSVFGNSHPTNDGTCIRDFIYIEDLCRAHLLALENLLGDPNIRTEAFQVFNLGTGNGHSILDLVQEVEGIVKKKVKFRMQLGSKSEASILIADSSKVRSKLGFVPEKSEIKEIIQSAYDWYIRN